ncbi:hypothetical protein SK128_016601 [Halocaridina rubra]|uniref:Uncharacterized protein n=1 Tax=Halocaridina rubra TaxID=373956 RepID=A0AAN8X5G7_HALRR
MGIGELLWKITSRERYEEKVEKTFYRRQFDNVKRVFKQVDEMPGSVIANIQATFLLPSSLAK